MILDSNGRIIPVGCWAHARREFYDARQSQPREVHRVLALIGQMYDIEDEIKGRAQSSGCRRGRSGACRFSTGWRRTSASSKSDALPKSQYGKAIAYALNHWDRAPSVHARTACWRSTTTSRNGRCGSCAIGRNNWMFLGSDRGGETAAIYYTILADAKRYQIEPFAYVRALLIELTSDNVDLEKLLPDVWIKEHPEHVLTYRRDEAEAAAKTRRRRRALRREQAKTASASD